MSKPDTSVVILGGGPGGYEAALVAAQLGARVTVVDSDGLGGACVLTDCVPSKTLIATSETMVQLRGSDSLGIEIPGASGAGNGDPGSSGRGGAGTRQAAPGERDWINAPRLYGRVKALAQAQSQLVQAGTTVEWTRQSQASDLDQRRADLSQAQARLRELEAGSRPQEIKESSAAVEAAQTAAGNFHPQRAILRPAGSHIHAETPQAIERSGAGGAGRVAAD